MIHGNSPVAAFEASEPAWWHPHGRENRSKIAPGVTILEPLSFSSRIVDADAIHLDDPEPAIDRFTAELAEHGDSAV